MQSLLEWENPLLAGHHFSYYKLYLKLITFWKSKFPDSIFDANYEKIVSNPEEETKKLLSFCNLNWDPECLNYHKNKKTPIQTVSVNQARKPIYNSSLKSFDKFKEYLTILDKDL